ncbi:hypothetical protein KR767_18815 [Luteibacter anthropi]|uniref:hypothetical protein n=1 Tax=Luteibacter anthropi TaxID=564369 RepID=UPI002032C12A|nr:hypothetical protein [Luteibacter anthropi]URX62074.1 hypothetical protein KR767_18815 [Luteibacter anthropi]
MYSTKQVNQRTNTLAKAQSYGCFSNAACVVTSEVIWFPLTKWVTSAISIRHSLPTELAPLNIIGLSLVSGNAMPFKEVISGDVGEVAWTARVEPLENSRYLLDEVKAIGSGQAETVGLIFSTMEHLRSYAQEVAESIMERKYPAPDE